MTLAELLSELRNNILHDRSDRVAGTSDYLWTDETLIRYIDEAQRRFARKGLVLRDGSTAEVVEVTLVEGQTEYVLHQSVLAVISAKNEDDMADLKRAGHSAFGAYQTADSYYFDPSQFALMSPGKPLAYSTDEQIGADENASLSAVTLRVYPAPSADWATKKIKLRVVRLPLERLSIKSKSQVPEIPEDHHLEMLDWAAYLALRIVDHDAGNPARANEFRASFEAHVREARNNVMRKLFTPQQWGFGRNGFSWEK